MRRHDTLERKKGQTRCNSSSVLGRQPSAFIPALSALMHAPQKRVMSIDAETNLSGEPTAVLAVPKEYCSVACPPCP